MFENPKKVVELLKVAATLGALSLPTPGLSQEWLFSESNGASGDNTEAPQLTDVDPALKALLDELDGAFEKTLRDVTLPKPHFETEDLDQKFQEIEASIRSLRFELPPAPIWPLALLAGNTALFVGVCAYQLARLKNLENSMGSQGGAEKRSQDSDAELRNNRSS